MPPIRHLVKNCELPFDRKDLSTPSKSNNVDPKGKDMVVTSKSPGTLPITECDGMNDSRQGGPTIRLPQMDPKSSLGGTPSPLIPYSLSLVFNFLSITHTTLDCYDSFPISSPPQSRPNSPLISPILSYSFCLGGFLIPSNIVPLNTL